MRPCSNLVVCLLAASLAGCETPVPDAAAQGDTTVVQDKFGWDSKGAADASGFPSKAITPDGAEWDGDALQCKPGLVPAPDTGHCVADSCDALWGAYQQQIQEDAAAEWASECRGDEECVYRPVAECMAGCGVVMTKTAFEAMQKAGALAAFDAEFAQVTGVVAKCGCATATCSNTVPACIAHQCVGTSGVASCNGPAPANATCASGNWVCKKGFFALDVAKGCAPAICEAMMAAADEAHAGLAKSLGACTADADCKAVFPSCSTGCWLAVRADQASAWQEGAHAITKATCKSTEMPWGCTSGGKNCAEPPVQCLAGQCAVQGASKP